MYFLMENIEWKSSMKVKKLACKGELIVNAFNKFLAVIIYVSHIKLQLISAGSVVLGAGLRAGARHPDLRGAQGHRQRSQVHRRGRGHRGRRRLRRGNRLCVRVADHRLRQEPLAQAAGTTRINMKQSVTQFVKLIEAIMCEIALFGNFLIYDKHLEIRTQRSQGDFSLPNQNKAIYYH